MLTFLFLSICSQCCSALTAGWQRSSHTVRGMSVSYYLRRCNGAPFTLGLYNKSEKSAITRKFDFIIAYLNRYTVMCIWLVAGSPVLQGFLLNTLFCLLQSRDVYFRMIGISKLSIILCVFWLQPLFSIPN